MKVRIKATPHESEIDGVRLDTLHPGTVRDMYPAVAAWLIAEGYAEPEMRAVRNEFDPAMFERPSYPNDRRARR